MMVDGDETTAAVTATPAAIEVIHRLSAAHGPLAFFQSAGCCDGGSPMCLKDGELSLSPHDVRLGSDVAHGRVRLGRAGDAKRSRA
jgi:uncharacterized protein (DUF779 family)